MIVKKISGKLNMFKMWILTLLMSIMSTVNVYATVDGETQYDNVVNWILGWIGRLGIVVAIYGAVQISSSFSTDDPGQRRKGIMELISGLMLCAIGYGARAIIGF